MVAVLLRFARVMVGQALSFWVMEFGGVNIPMLNISIGAAISAAFKYLREKYPNNKILEWFPL